MADEYDRKWRETLFTCGYCWVFTTVLRDDYGLPARGALNAFGIPTHCWGVFNKDGVDYQGIRPEGEILKDCRCDAKPADLTEYDLTRMSMPPAKMAKALDYQLFDLAREILNTENRFKSLRNDK